MTDTEDDGDLGETYRAWRRVKQAKRADNRKNSAELLTAEGIPFESRNGGVHLIVAGRYDFWPGTGLWRKRGGATEHRGVQRLINRIRRDAK